MALVNMVDSANITRLQRYVKATTLVPGDDAGISARTVNNLAAAVKGFAEAGAQRDAAAQAQALAKVYEGTAWYPEVHRRVETLLKQWRFEKLIDGDA
ncbi:MAG: hypothetical protein E6R04_08365 [Spirochaetes bacterium]|nr:MAG: hypothetical protein E6R04_08365 [Spirochaetota bacterium]